MRVFGIFFIGLCTIFIFSRHTTADSDLEKTPKAQFHQEDSTESDTIWNVVIYIEFGVDSNGHIHDVAAEQPFDCFKCDSSMINDLKQEAIETVEAMPRWDNYQHKDIKYEIPIHMVRTHPHHTHKVHHNQDSIRIDQD